MWLIAEPITLRRSAFYFAGHFQKTAALKSSAVFPPGFSAFLGEMYPWLGCRSAHTGDGVRKEATSWGAPLLYLGTGRDSRSRLSFSCAFTLFLPGVAPVWVAIGALPLLSWMPPFSTILLRRAPCLGTALTFPSICLHQFSHPVSDHVSDSCHQEHGSGGLLFCASH